MILALVGGSLIGIAVSLMLVFNGRVTGVSGIVSGLLPLKKSDFSFDFFSWRFMFVLGLISGGVILRFTRPESFNSESLNMNLYDYMIAGFLVGFGTVLGNGCTSGHGVCGLSRLSTRSLASTITFILFGIISVLIFKRLRGEL